MCCSRRSAHSWSSSSSSCMLCQRRRSCGPQLQWTVSSLPQLSIRSETNGPMDARPLMWGLYRSELTAVSDPVSHHLHQPLTSSVLHTGHCLLNCIDATSPCVCVCVCAKHIQSAPASVPVSITPPLPSSPVLRDTLLMIERTSGAVGQQEDVREPSDLDQVRGLLDVSLLLLPPAV